MPGRDSKLWNCTTAPSHKNTEFNNWLKMSKRKINKRKRIIIMFGTT